MTIIQSIILGIIQGVTEFLPVSSSGHLVLFQKIFGITVPTMTFDISVHMGTLLAVVLVFKDDIISIIKRPFQRLTWLLLAGTIPTGIIGIVFKDFFEQLFHTGSTLGIEFLITGTVLLFAERLASGTKKADKATYLDAAFVGVMQGAAILPAVSRSGLTISGALMRNFDKEFAAKFSFLLSIPAILGAALIDMKDMVSAGGEAANYSVLFVGSIAAAIAGYISIKYFIEILKKGKLKYFAYYVYIIGGLVIIDQFFTKIIFK